ncbi:MAG: hypothetical protein IIZ33_09535, partial [Erysipelotrichaceae bacterium]|nr:hypothetical protein [Erysipelotrichaceae bacterium]
MKGIKEKTAKKAVFYIYTFLSAVLVPLFLRDHYFDLIQAKSDVFRIGLLLLVFLSSAILLFSKEEKKGKADPVCIALILFAGLAVFSSLFSDNPGGSFWGVVGWRIGSFQIAASVFLICFLKDTDIDERRLWLPLTVISDLIILLAVLHSASVDIFDLHEGILRSEYFSYLSTIGNANWLGVYLCLIFPVIFFRYLDSRGREEVFYAVSGFLCLFGLLLSNSDSAYAGLGLMSAAAIPSVLKNRKGVPFLLTATGVSCLLVKLPCFSLKRETLSGISTFLMKDIVIAALLITGILLILLRKKEIPEKVLKISVLLYRFALLLLTAFFVKGMIEAYTSF